MNIAYHPLTISELNSAVAYYNRQRAGLGDELRSEVYVAIERILSNPAQCAVLENGIRRCLVHRFPYSILYRSSDDAVRVLAIRHHRRHQKFGLGRR